MEIWRERNVATVVYFPLIDRGTLDFENTPPTFVAADCQFSKDKAAFANTGSTPVHEGNGMYSLDLLATEIDGQNTIITIIDSATKLWEDQAIIVTTYGDSSAEHAVNLNDGVRAGLTALPNAAADAAGGVPISDLGGLDLDAKLANTNEVTAARMGALTDWINGGRLDLLLDAIPTTAMRGTDSAALASEVTSARMSELDDSGGKLVAVADLIQTAVDAIKLETDKLTLGDAGAGVAGSIIEEIENRPTTAMRGTDNAALASEVTSARMSELDTSAGKLVQVADDIKALLPTALVGGRMDSDIGAKTGNVALSAQEKLDVNTEVDTGFTTQMADSVPADGTIATREQAAYMIVQMLTDFKVSSTTLTVRKVDGTTTLMTFTLDDATNPTDLTRVT